MLKYLLSIILFFFHLNSVLLAESQYSLVANGNVNIITEHKYSENHYFRNYTIKGSFEDNLGNYGSSDTSVIAEYKNNNVINLQWSGKITYQNNKVVFAQGIRKKGIDEGGVGKLVLFSGEEPLNVLDNIKCNYAVKFFKDNAFSKWICDLPKEKITILQNLE